MTLILSSIQFLCPCPVVRENALKIAPLLQELMDDVNKLKDEKREAQEKLDNLQHRTQSTEKERWQRDIDEYRKDCEREYREQLDELEKEKASLAQDLLTLAKGISTPTFPGDFEAY